MSRHHRFSGRRIIPRATTAASSCRRSRRTPLAFRIWQDEVAHARANCAVRRLDDVSPFMGAEVSLRWIYTHMIAEYARHCGHADIVRERIDGATGV